MSKQQEMAKRIIAAIKDEQNHIELNMDSWVDSNMDSWVDTRNGTVSLDQQLPPACGTTMCIAGFAAFLDGWTLNMEGGTTTKDGVERVISDVAAELLDLDSHDLFFTNNAVAMLVLEKMVAGEKWTWKMQEEVYDAWCDD